MIKLINILKEINLDNISNLKSFKNLPSNLKLLTKKGSTRDVYEYNNDYVLKIAKNKKGLEQNKHEVEILNKYNSPLFPKLKKYDDKNYRYIVIEKVEVFKNSSSFYKFMYPKIDIIYKKLLDFGNDNIIEYFIPSYIFSKDKSLIFNYGILKPFYNKKDISFITRKEMKKLQNLPSLNNDDIDDDDLLKHSSPDQRITFMTYEEMNNLLDNNYVKEMKKLINQGYKPNDLHWGNFGYKDNQLKILDLGL